MKLDPFYLIVDSAAWIERLVPLGLKLVQLRIKDQDDASLRREIRASKALCERHGCQLIVNDYWRIAIEEDCDFVHLGQEDLLEADMKAIRKAGVRLGLSTHDDAELETALRAEPDYVALGPIYPTVFKAMKWAPQGLDRIAVWKQRVGNTPLVAIGGLTVERIAGVFAQGAQSAAVVTDITRNAEPEARALEWLAATAPWR
ncbi:thiamine phosphate synthase [Mesorhizobium sp. M00.F.Ca.ET.170.01.1.1]|nr:thiamine phosphate synthase [Mesorhizobium sp. M00.F.Ca.ET.170.01.1.1]